ncbi:type I-D CRISPR-associated protein Cas10d/Csc3 [Oculatella sp. FACHB-28]|uniref:type I-D CRISPR-associated protein Cas10d/Csc3 n=1 Tax=Oculatella sp. FACHB-28 TaxID=2692845 RepID=UPI0016859F68|nr:type I-D CRISPR-associated protein Cas10d/Csc3 [Oculatella sp. FACHB-28]MBD2060483.1 type I-D CRISPR-associated protein Cas10d/Csc3 [Oculatella sp. FACHB-28]
MATLLQTLLLQTLPADLDPVLLAYIETVLPAVEQKFGMLPVVEGSSNDRFVQLGKLDEVQRVFYSTNDSDQSLLIFILNGLLTVWNLLPFLSKKLALSDSEKRLLCLGFTFQGYRNLWQHSAKTSERTPVILLGETLNLDAFWAGWQEYLPELTYIVPTIYQTAGERIAPTKQSPYKIPEPRLKLLLNQLLTFGKIAAHISDPADIVVTLRGNYLQGVMNELGINRTLIYHRLRNCIGLLTNSIHNAVLQFTEKLDWQPILFFPEGIIYLAPPNSGVPTHIEFQEFAWKQISDRLIDSMLRGEAGFKRDGKGLKAAPQTLELFSPAQLIRNLPSIIKAYVRNEKEPATPKRLVRLSLDSTEQEFLAGGADLRSDRLAEFLILVQREFFRNRPEFIAWILEKLEIQSDITPEQTQRNAGGVNLGWYHAAAHYVAKHPTPNSNNPVPNHFLIELQDLAEQLATWAEQNQLLPTHPNPTREIFYDYVTQYLEIQSWDVQATSFQRELAGYVNAKTKLAKQPICSLSSGEFLSEDQVDSVVLFKPQQYSNKNSLGGRQLKRGISKIWSLEMLLRQAFWSVPAGKLEDQQPIFLYLFPAFVHAPQITKAIRLLVNQLKQVNLWEIRRFWQEHGMDANALRFYPWLRTDLDSNTEDKRDLPFLAVTYTTTKGKTTTDAWIEPAFLAIALPLLLGIKVVATASSVPSYNRGSEFQATAQVDGPASFWSLLGLPTTLHLEEHLQEQSKHLSDWIDRLLIAYTIHLDCRSKPPDSRWQSFPGTVHAIVTDVLAIFSLARSHFQNLSDDKVQQYWEFAQIWAAGDLNMEQQLELTQRLVQEYRMFYRVHVAKSSYAIVLPLSKVLEDILSTSSDLPIETLMLQTAGRLHDALKRQEPYKRPLIMDQSLSIEIRVNNEIQAIHQFVTTCIKDLFLGQYKGDRALLQEHRHRVKSGAEFAYRLLAMQESESKTKQQDVEGAQL